MQLMCSITTVWVWLEHIWLTGSFEERCDTDVLFSLAYSEKSEGKTPKAAL